MAGWMQRFWTWYERHYTLNVSIAGALFGLQILHLVWLTLHVVVGKLSGNSWFPLSPGWQLAMVVVDYTEIPALISTTILYLHDLKNSFRWKWVLYIIFLDIQWLHLFWITDEFVLDAFSPNPQTILPVWLAWIAIFIDYLELPVILDTFRRMIKALHGMGIRKKLSPAMKYYVSRKP